MSLLPLCLALVLAPAPVSPPRQAADGQAPTTTRYRIHQAVETAVDLSAFGQPEQVQTQDLTWFTTVTATDSAGGRALRVVLDSVQADMGMAPIPAGAVTAARGTAFRAWLDPLGKMATVRREGGEEAGGMFAAVFEGQLRGLYPRWKPGAQAGEHWSDTLDVQTRTVQATTTVRTVTTFVHRGEEAQGGEPALRLDADFSTETSGALQTPGGPADMAGTGTGTATYHVARDGRLLAMTATTQGNATVSGDFAPMPIPLRIRSTVTMGVLP